MIAHVALAVSVLALVFALDWVAAEDLACDRLRREVARLRAELAERESRRPCRTCRPGRVDTLDARDRLRREVARLRAELAERESRRPCHVDTLDARDRGPWAD
jgi:uncharacterized small protein (DUF1192 family)